MREYLYILVSENYVALILLADTITPEAMALVKKTRRTKTYRFNLYGFSNYRLLAIETSTGRLAYNRQGGSLEKLFRNIIKKSKESM